MEVILSRVQQREEAAVKRERTMAYAYLHQVCSAFFLNGKYKNSNEMLCYFHIVSFLFTPLLYEMPTFLVPHHAYFSFLL